jgi:hypothetical protein
MLTKVAQCADCDTLIPDTLIIYCDECITRMQLHESNRQLKRALDIIEMLCAKPIGDDWMRADQFLQEHGR